MESGNGASSSTGIFIPVPVNSDAFHERILALFQSAYLFEESKHCFRYTSAFLIENPTLEDRYNACREKRRGQGYSDTELKETYGFLLFDELNKVKSIGETSVLAENGTCTTLGDPNKGVYLSMYSDSLDLNRWYHGKSGYIAIVKITEGRVKKVSENYTQNLTEPTVGFDCHVSEQLQSVSSKTSSFLAFERTQYYLYELLDNGRTALSPSLACPYAFVEFSYTDNKGTLPQQDNFEEKKISCPYSPWMGKLQLGSQTFNIGIRSPAGALSWAKLPPIIKVEWAISMLILRKLLPKAIFETSFNGKVLLEHSYYSLCEIVDLNLEDKEQLKPLLLEIKKQDLALIIALNEGGFLILLHDSNFISHDKDNGITTDKALQGLFMFSESKNIQRDTKIELINQSLPSDALRVLPLLIYAEGEVEKASNKPNEDLCDIIVQHMQNYVTLINPGLPSSRFREVDIFPDQYDMLDANRHLYSTPEWTDTQWHSLKSYLSNANSFQLPVCKASEILVAGQEAQQEDLEDDIYICLSSPEEPSTSLISTGSEDRLDPTCSPSVEISDDSAQRDSTISQLLLPCVLPAQEVTSEIFDSTVFTEKGDEHIDKAMSLRTDEPSGELIVSITSAAQTIDERLDVIKHDQFSVTARLQEATLNTFSEIVQSKITLNCSNDNSFLTESDKLPQGHHLESTETPALQMVKTLFEKDESICVDHVRAQELSLYVNRGEIQRSEQESDTQTSTSLADSVLLKELETRTLRKKTERWGLKPVVTTCGRIFIPFGSVEMREIRLLQEKLQPTKENLDHPEEMIVGASSEVSNTSNDKQQQRHFDNEAPTEPIEEVATKSNGPMTLNKRAKDELRNGTDHLALEDDNMKDFPTTEQSKGQIMLRKLKSVILKKRKIDALKEDLNINCVLDNEPSPKRAKNDLTPVTMRNFNDPCVKGSSIGDANPNLLSVDPIFAQALGLTPKKAQHLKPLGEIAVHRSESSGTKEKFVAREYSYKLQTPSSPKGTRLKMLKKHQNLSADQVKRKWWLHFQTPACYGEKQLQGCLSDILVRKTIKEKTNSSSEALNLLADLALSTDKGQVSPHPAQECEFEANLEKCDNTKDVTNPEQQSVLHALLRQPVVKSIQPQEPSAPDCFGASGLIDVIYQEHAYSLPSSPSLLLALPAPFQVSPLNGSATLLRSQRLWDGAHAMPPGSPEGNVEQNERACRDPKRSWHTRKFCLSRTIENRNKTICITRHWKEEYDFNLDSRFTVDLKDKAIVRALHGPWDSSIHDTNEEVQLIVHMWIGLFYSRSTARFFHLDPDVTFPAPENSVLCGLDVSNEKRPEQSHSNIVGHSPLLNAEDKPETDVLDLSIPKNGVKDTEPAMFNVEIAKENPKVATQEHINETQVPEDLNTLNPEVLQTTLPIQCYLKLMQTAGVAPLNYVSIPLNQNTGNSPEINQQLFIPVWNGITYPNLWTNNAQSSSLLSLESGESHQIENTTGNLPKKPLSPIRKRVYHSRYAKLSGPDKNLSNSNMDLYPTNEDVDAISSNHLLEIKKKYMEKLKAVSSLVKKNIDSSLPQNATKGEKSILLKELLQEDIIGERPKLQSFSTVKTVGCQNPKLNATCNKKSWINQSGFLSQEVPSYPKDSTASIVKETTCTENLSGHKPFHTIAVAPFVESTNPKAPLVLDLSATVSNLQEKNQPAGEFVAKKCSDTSMRKQDAMVENSQTECARTIESPVMNKINIMQRCPNDEAENYYSVDSSTGMNAPLEDKLQEQASKEMDKRGFEDMEVGPSDSAEVKDNASYDGHGQHGEQLVAGSEVHLPSDLGNSEPNDRCPTPTIDEQPFVYASQPNLNSDGKDMDKVFLDSSGGKNITSLTAVIDETAITDVQSHVELRTLRTLKCLDEYLSTLQKTSNQSVFSSKDALNSPIYSNKESSSLSCDSNNKKTATSMDDPCPPKNETSESSQHLYMSPSTFPNDVSGNMQQLKQKCSNDDSSIVPDLYSKVEYSSKLIQSKDNDVEKPKSNKPSTSSEPGMAGTKDQGHLNFQKVKTNLDCDAQPKPVIRFSIKKTKQGRFFCSGPVFESHNQIDNSADNFFPSKCKNPDRKELQNIKLAEAISSTMTTQPVESNENTVLQVAKHDPDILVTDNKTGDKDLLNCSTSFVDSKTNKITDDSLGTRCSLSCTVSNTNRKVSSFLEKVSKRCLQDNPTQSSMDSECLIFFDQMKTLLTRKQDQEAQCDQSNLPSSCPITLQFSHLPEQDDVLHDIEIPLSFFNQKIAVDMSDKELLRDATQQSFSNPQPKGSLEQPGVSAITAQCTQLYKTIMDKICSANRNASLMKDLHKTDSDDSTANSSSYFDFCSQMKREIDDSFHNSLNSVVKKSCKSKNRFFLLVTSDDAFFNETQAYLEAEGHTAVQPLDFFIKENSSPLLVIIRNEDIAEHIFEVPHLLELRKSLDVQFAGIDEPDDVVNLTYQELFIKGGFVMFDRAAVESLSPGNMKKILEILQKLSQTGKWKWLLHYRDSRRLKENARLCPKAKEKTDLLNKCKEDGLLDILPYHECDLMSRQEPNYLQCLCRQQIQNISSRYPVFVSDSRTDNGFEKNGIMAMTINSFLMGLLRKTINGST
ncbi:uncharacterized protein tasor2 [Eucyclogobius newberryi]|uniref:uncharacterized protein tasor2 n=1 Tax=Eucyclogobius newberryi TaxID=166745 RepID=UPI003B5918CB